MITGTLAWERSSLEPAGKKEEDVGSRLMRDTSCRRGSRPGICLEAGAKTKTKDVSGPAGWRGRMSQLRQTPINPGSTAGCPHRSGMAKWGYSWPRLSLQRRCGGSGGVEEVEVNQGEPRGRFTAATSCNIQHQAGARRSVELRPPTETTFQMPPGSRSTLESAGVRASEAFEKTA